MACVQVCKVRGSITLPAVLGAGLPLALLMGLALLAIQVHR